MTNVAERDEAELLAERLVVHEGYLAARVLEDGSVAGLLNLLYTRAIVLGCNEWAYASRFCFEDKTLANRRFDELTGEDDVPQGFIARR